ncbi:MAG: dipeptidase [Thermodesulfobacteriota bacterium]
MTSWETYQNSHQARFVNELLDFLRIPSVSSLPEHAGDVQRAAEWLSHRLQAVGIEGVRVIPTSGHPMVYGEWLHATGKPTILIYGHFDVQPADPLEAWNNPPFEPVIRDGRVYARGATDNKGNMFAPIVAVESLLKSQGVLPVNVKFLFEGQEEIGSPQLPDFMTAHRELLACDLVLSADGGQWSEDQPALLVSFKGAVGVQIDVKGSHTDVHSGIYGGAIHNPIHALVRILDSMRDAEGRILVEGFYDGVVPLTQVEKNQIAEVPFDESEYKKNLDIDDLFGEPGYTTWERAWARPTLEINGIWGGFQGQGTKTIVPGKAHAKITCRLTPSQDPKKIVELLTAHVEKHAPRGVRVTVDPLPVFAYPYYIPPDHPGNRAAAAVLKELYGKEPFYIRTGGSLPVLHSFLNTLGVYTVIFAFNLEDEGEHAPNEFFRLSSFERGSKAYVLLLNRLGEDQLGCAVKP